MSFDKLSYHKGDALSLPKGWEIKKLGEIASFSQGIQVGLEHHLTEPKEGYVRFIRIVDYTQNTDDIRYIPNPGEKYFVNEEDIVMVRYGTPGLIGRGKAGVIANNLFKIKIERKDLTNDYLTLFLSQEHIQNYLGTQGSATMPALNFGQLKTVEVKFPPLPEQQRIVSILDEAFAIIAKAKANAEQNLKNAKELFESYLQGVFEKKGDGWEEKNLGEVYDVRDGTHDSPKYHNQGYPLITSKNLKNHKLTFDNIKFISETDYLNINKRSKVDVGDVLFAMIGTIGNPVVIEDEPNYAIKNVALFKVGNNQNSYFLKYFLDSKQTIEKMMRDAKGTTQKFVGLGYLRSFPILVPPLKEQQTIVHQLDALRAETQKLEAVYQKKIADLEELKKSILQKAFAGELTQKEIVV